MSTSICVIIGNESGPFSFWHRNKERPGCFLVSKDDLCHRATGRWAASGILWTGEPGISWLVFREHITGEAVSRDLLDCESLLGESMFQRSFGPWKYERYWGGEG